MTLRYKGEAMLGIFEFFYPESAMAIHDVVRVDGEGLRLVSVLEASRS